MGTDEDQGRYRALSELWCDIAPTVGEPEQFSSAGVHWLLGLSQ
jgi:hypothetical protein